ncbi:MAG TPA: serine/threonine-protein kinase [Trebonia sp.]|nr:serine/threonine-protein kinase [Trebonia sp.]
MGETGAAPGRRIAGYALQERIGAGAGTQTFRAHDEATGRVVALRVVTDPAMASDQKFRDMFLGEAQAIAALGDPHIAPVYAVGADGDALYVATRFVFGNSLATMLRPVNSSLPPMRVAALVTQVAAALDAAHGIGLVHHCLKPANILMGAYPGRPEQAYVSDFGLAKLAFDYWSTAAAGDRPAAALTLGEADYLAPESTRGQHADGRADQYALSCVAFRMLTGTVPFSRPTSPATLLAHLYGTVPRLSALLPELPDTVDAVLSKAMAKDPAERYGSCGELAVALRDALPSS